MASIIEKPDLASNGNDDELEVSLTGRALLGNPVYNKGTAFTERERREFGLQGLLPPHIDSLNEHVIRAYEAYQTKTTDLGRHVYLRSLQDTNETLFYRLVLDNLIEMMPIIYTPVVGMACEKFSHIYRRPQGLFVSYPERDVIDVILNNTKKTSVDVIVVTDGERILGLGDQGVGGMAIPIGKLSLYVLCGGINPNNTLPIFLDVGTNNPERLNDPLYVGWRHERIQGQEYYDFLDRFVSALKRKFPTALIQWEDFSREHAYPILKRYQHDICTFNDDIQGTAAVAVATMMSAVKITESLLTDQRIVVFGAGSAGCGICSYAVEAMVAMGLTKAEARARFYLVDKDGLLHQDMIDISPFQRKYARQESELETWDCKNPDKVSLYDVVKNVKPTILIGVSGQCGMFTEEIIREMASHTSRPIILALSNPSSRAEAMPEHLINWTEGRALIATGSPFPDISFHGQTFPVSQCNNTYIFPGLGLGVIAAGANRVTDSMLMAAAMTLSEYSPARPHESDLLLPKLTDIREISKHIALAVGQEAQHLGITNIRTEAELKERIKRLHWEPKYRSMRHKK